MKITKRFTAMILAVLFLVSGCSSASANGTEAAPVIQFSHESGLYEETFTLTLSASVSGTIRYTLDGSAPSHESEVYSQGLEIADRTEEENILSAIVVSSNDRGGRTGGQDDTRTLPANDGQEAGTGMQVPGGADETPPDLTQDMSPEEGRQQPDQSEMPQMGGGLFGGGSSSAPEENVFKGTAVAAALFSDSGERLSDIFYRSYFVSEDIHSRYGDMAIVSIITDADNLYDEERGLYTNYNESGSDWERPVHLTILEADGSVAVSQNTGLRLSGNSTRGYAQKSLRFYAKNSYDEVNPTIEYELFEGLTTSGSEDELLTTFKRLALRNSGQDNSSTLFRDAIMQAIADDLNVDTQASRMCVAFVNGEFWGIYTMQERYDDHYFSNHYDIDPSQVTILELAQTSTTPEVSEGEESDLDYYNEMWNFFSDHDLSDPDNYAKALEYIDIDNFIDYYIVNIYSDNTDWPANNNLFWRYKTENGAYDAEAEAWYKDGRYRWFIKDMDFGFGLMGSASNDTLAHAMSESESMGGGFGGGQRPNDIKDMPEEGAENRGGTRPDFAGDGNAFDPSQFQGSMGGRPSFDADGDAPEVGISDIGERQGGNRGAMGFTDANSTLFFRKLLENDAFQAAFVNRFCDVMNTNYDVSYVLALIDTYQSELEPAIEEQIARYPGTVSSVEVWHANIEAMREFVTDRPGNMRGILAETFSLGDEATVTLITEGEGGHLLLNAMEITAATKGVADPTNWSGIYFMGTTQQITAVAAEGKTFVKYIVTEESTGTQTEHTNPVLSLTISGHLTVTAVFG